MWHLLNSRITVMEGFKFLGLAPNKHPMELNLCSVCISAGAAGEQHLHATGLHPGCQGRQQYIWCIACQNSCYFIPCRNKREGRGGPSDSAAGTRQL